MAFQPARFTKQRTLLPALVGSYPTFSPLPTRTPAVSLSAALAVNFSFRKSPLPVRKSGALCCPDFPLPIAGQRQGGVCAGAKVGNPRGHGAYQGHLFSCPASLPRATQILPIKKGRPLRDGPETNTRRCPWFIAIPNGAGADRLQKQHEPCTLPSPDDASPWRTRCDQQPLQRRG